MLRVCCERCCWSPGSLPPPPPLFPAPLPAPRCCSQPSGQCPHSIAPPRPLLPGPCSQPRLPLSQGGLTQRVQGPPPGHAGPRDQGRGYPGCGSERRPAGSRTRAAAFKETEGTAAKGAGQPPGPATSSSVSAECWRERGRGSVGTAWRPRPLVCIERTASSAQSDSAERPLEAMAGKGSLWWHLGGRTRCAPPAGHGA